MEEQKWGIGNKKDGKPFDSVKIGDEIVPMIYGEFPHTRQDNHIYIKEGSEYTGFSGHRMPFKIEIEEYNYIKRSGLSGDEVRKGCKAKLFVKDILIMNEFHRDYQRAFKMIDRFIDDMENDWWIIKPEEVSEKIGTKVRYKGNLYIVEGIIVGQSCAILKPLDEKSSDEEEEEITKVYVHEINWYEFKKE